MKTFCLPIFNRATYFRCRSFIEAIEAEEFYSLTLILGGSLNEKDYESPADYIRSNHPGTDCIVLSSSEYSHVSSDDNIIHATGNILSALGSILGETTFDAGIVVADRFETIGAALAFSFRNIPLIHIQGGEITGNIDERIRHAVTKLSDYHFTSTACARDYVIRMGEERSRTFRTGCPSLDTITAWRISRRKSKEKFIICMWHPDTDNKDTAYDDTSTLMHSVMDFCHLHDCKVYWYAPNPDPGREKVMQLVDWAQAEYPNYFVKMINEDPFYFLDRLSQARLIVGNSSCAIREASFLGVPAVNVGFRQSLRERSINVLDVEISKDSIMDAMQSQYDTYKYKKSYLYGTGEAAQNMIYQLDKMDLTRKTTLTYPDLLEFRYKHFGEERFDEHTKKTTSAAKRKAYNTKGI